MSGDLRGQYGALMESTRLVTSQGRALVVAAAQAEEDAELLRSAVLEALEIFTTHKERSVAWAEMGSPEQATGALANAAELMASRLNDLHRVHTSSEPL